jgi:hypothetical protein
MWYKAPVASAVCGGRTCSEDAAASVTYILACCEKGDGQTATSGVVFGRLCSVCVAADRDHCCWTASTKQVGIAAPADTA